MAITTRDGLIDALANNSSRIVIDKASLANAAAGQHFSLWTATGVPGAGSAPGAVGSRGSRHARLYAQSDPRRYFGSRGSRHSRLCGRLRRAWYGA